MQCPNGFARSWTHRRQCIKKSRCLPVNQRLIAPIERTPHYGSAKQQPAPRNASPFAQEIATAASVGHTDSRFGDHRPEDVCERERERGRGRGREGERVSKRRGAGTTLTMSSNFLVGKPSEVCRLFERDYRMTSSFGSIIRILILVTTVSLVKGFVFFRVNFMLRPNDSAHHHASRPKIVCQGTDSDRKSPFCPSKNGATSLSRRKLLSVSLLPVVALSPLCLISKGGGQPPQTIDDLSKTQIRRDYDRYVRRCHQGHQSDGALLPHLRGLIADTPRATTTLMLGAWPRYWVWIRPGFVELIMTWACARLSACVRGSRACAGVRP